MDKKEYCQIWYQRNKDRISQEKRDYYLTIRQERIDNYNKQYYKTWYAENKDRVLKQRKTKYHKTRKEKTQVISEVIEEKWVSHSTNIFSLIMNYLKFRTPFDL